MSGLFWEAGAHGAGFQLDEQRRGPAGVVVIVPAYGLEGARALNCDAVLEHLRAGGFRTLTVAPQNGGSESHARNLGAELAALEDEPPGVLVFNDADSVTPHRQILEAVRQARQAPGLVYAYTLYCRVGETATNQFRFHVETVDERLGPGVGETIFAPPSMACAAIRADCFAEVGGFDPRFLDWGYEDCDFAGRCETRWRTRRVDGPTYHLWHGPRREDGSPADRSSARTESNRQLYLANSKAREEARSSASTF